MSTILVDNLTGKTSAGSITVTSEGGAATQSLQQGLAKAWVNFNGTGTIATRDSLNVASLTDNGTGNYSNNLTNSMSAANFSSFAGGDVNNANDDVRRNIRLFRIEAGLVKVVCGYNANSNTKEDWTNVYTSIFGDLA